MTTRRDTLKTLAGATVVGALSGCAQLTNQGPLQRAATPAMRVGGGPGLGRAVRLKVSRTVEAGGASREVTTTNWGVVYQSVSVNPVNDPPTVATFSTPSVELAGEELNPVADLSLSDFATGLVEASGAGSNGMPSAVSIGSLGETNYVTYETIAGDQGSGGFDAVVGTFSAGGGTGSPTVEFPESDPASSPDWDGDTHPVRVTDDDGASTTVGIRFERHDGDYVVLLATGQSGESFERPDFGFENATALDQGTSTAVPAGNASAGAGQASVAAGRFVHPSNDGFSREVIEGHLQSVASRGLDGLVRGTRTATDEIGSLVEETRGLLQRASNNTRNEENGTLGIPVSQGGEAEIRLAPIEGDRILDATAGDGTATLTVEDADGDGAIRLEASNNTRHEENGTFGIPVSQGGEAEIRLAPIEGDRILDATAGDGTATLTVEDADGDGAIRLEASNNTRSEENQTFGIPVPNEGGENQLDITPTTPETGDRILGATWETGDGDAGDYALLTVADANSDGTINLTASNNTRNEEDQLLGTIINDAEGTLAEILDVLRETSGADAERLLEHARERESLLGEASAAAEDGETDRAKELLREVEGIVREDIQLVEESDIGTRERLLQLERELLEQVRSALAADASNNTRHEENGTFGIPVSQGGEAEIRLAPIEGDRILDATAGDGTATLTVEDADGDGAIRLEASNNTRSEEDETFGVFPETGSDLDRIAELNGTIRRAAGTDGEDLTAEAVGTVVESGQAMVTVTTDARDRVRSYNNTRQEENQTLSTIEQNLGGIANRAEQVVVVYDTMMRTQ